METITVHLLPSEITTLMIEAKGEGGYQSLIRRLQKKINAKTGEITLDKSEVERILKSSDYGRGTFQERLYEVFSRSLK